MLNFNLDRLPEYKQVCKHINPVYANIIFSYLREIRKKYYISSQILIETPIFNIGSENGKKHGISKRYSRNNKIKWETSYINNKENGFSIRYYRNGIINIKTSYVNGLRHGVEKEYYPYGKIWRKRYYENGKLIY
jgi:antitoxin component YwqK of YwqJK toxin-antitoxin module